MDKRIEKTYDLLLRSLFKILRDHPYDDITVLDICKEAGIQRPTFYNNFKDKRDFVDKILMWEFDQIIARNNISEDLSFEDFIIALLKGYILDLSFNRKNPVFLRSQDSISCLFKITINVEQVYFKEKYMTRRHKNPGIVDVDVLMFEYAGFFALQAHYFYYHQEISVEKMCDIIDKVKNYSLF